MGGPMCTLFERDTCTSRVFNTGGIVDTVWVSTIVLALFLSYCHTFVGKLTTGRYIKLITRKGTLTDHWTGAEAKYCIIGAAFDMTPSKAFQCPLSFQTSLKQGPYKHASFGTSCKLVGREWVWQLAAVINISRISRTSILGLQADYVHHNLVGKRAILRTGSLCGEGVFPPSAAFYCLSSVVAFIAEHFRCYCWRTNIQPLRSYKHIRVLFCIPMCKTLKHRLENSPVSQQALIQLEQPGDCFPFLRSMSCHSARFDESPDVECWREQNLPQRLVLWGSRWI